MYGWIIFLFKMLMLKIMRFCINYFLKVKQHSNIVHRGCWGFGCLLFCVMSQCLADLTHVLALLWVNVPIPLLLPKGNFFLPPFLITN